MSKEFEKLEALLYVPEPSERDPPVDWGEAAKLAARWGWLVRQTGGTARASSDAAAIDKPLFRISGPNRLHRQRGR